MADPSFYPDETAAVMADMLGGSYIDDLRAGYYSDDSVLADYRDYGGEKWGIPKDERVRRKARGLREARGLQ